MPFLDFEPEQRVVVAIIIIIVCFGLIARLDFVFGERDYLRDKPIKLPYLTIGQHWFWMNIGYIVVAIVITLLILLFAPDIDQNMWYAIGLGATIILFAVGQLEDFLWHIVNYFDGVRFPAGDWSGWGWTAENNLCWRIFGTWNTIYHLIWFSSFMIIVATMWYVIFTRT